MIIINLLRLKDIAFPTPLMRLPAWDSFSFSDKWRVDFLGTTFLRVCVPRCGCSRGKHVPRPRQTTQFPRQDAIGPNPVPIQGHDGGVWGNKILLLLDLFNSERASDSLDLPHFVRAKIYKNSLQSKRRQEGNGKGDTLNGFIK